MNRMVFFRLFGRHPGRAKREPGILRNDLWIPGSSLRNAPE
jgi:hypothetical protein